MFSLRVTKIILRLSVSSTHSRPLRSVVRKPRDTESDNTEDFVQIMLFLNIFLNQTVPVFLLEMTHWKTRLILAITLTGSFLIFESSSHPHIRGVERFQFHLYWPFLWSLCVCVCVCVCVWVCVCLCLYVCVCILQYATVFL